jgi:hypothetical protein
MHGDYETMAMAYTEDGKIFPDNSAVIAGREAIKKRWILPEGSSILHHEIRPEEINIIEDTAYDYGIIRARPGQNRGSWSISKGNMWLSGKRLKTSGKCTWTYGTGLPNNTDRTQLARQIKQPENSGDC